jgi:hypothetical protein
MNNDTTPPPSEKPTFFSKETITLIAALLAAVTSVTNVFLGSWRSMELERMKWQQSQDDTHQRERRLAWGEFARELGAASQRSMWVLWIAAHDPERMTVKELDDYDIATREIQPRLVSSQVILAAHDPSTNGRVRPLLNRYYQIDAEIAKCRIEFRKSPDAGVTALKSILSEHDSFLSTMPETLAGMAGGR